MNKALLPVLARLQSLQKVSLFAPEGGRIIASSLDPNPIAAVLREINETVLGRELCFTTDKGTSLTLEIAGRRILRLTDAKGLENAESCLGAAVLEDEHKDNLIKLLQGLAKQGQQIRLVTAATTQGTDGVSVGLPVALIADLLLAELNEVAASAAPEPMPVPEPEPMLEPEPKAGPGPEAEPMEAVLFPEATAGPSIIGRFARANGPVLMAWLILGGEEDGTVEGPEEMVEHLRGFLDDEIKDLNSQLDRLSATPGEPICIALGASLSEGHSLICARIDASILLGLAEGDSTQSLMQAWSSAFQ